jgi:hypothetical protein
MVNRLKIVMENIQEYSTWCGIQSLRLPVKVGLARRDIVRRQGRSPRRAPVHVSSVHRVGVTVVVTVVRIVVSVIVITRVVAAAVIAGRDKHNNEAKDGKIIPRPTLSSYLL